jgi:hypothetical protein
MRHFFRNVKETLKLMRRESSSNNAVKVCPVCLKDTLSIQPSLLTFIVPKTYHCTACEYNGPLYAEIPLDDYLQLKQAKMQAEENIQHNVEI